MSIAAASCHGRSVRFPTRPPAGTSPWEWYFDSPRNLPLLAWDFGPAKRLGETRWSRRGPMILLAHQMPPTQRASVLAHEMHHVEIGGVCSSLCDRNERLVRRETCRWLLPDIEQLASELERYPLELAADRLGVAHSIVRERLAFSTARERAALASVWATVSHMVPSTVGTMFG